MLVSIVLCMAATFAIGFEWLMHYEFGFLVDENKVWYMGAALVKGEQYQGNRVYLQ